MSQIPEQTARNYQKDLMKVAIKQNSIIFLPTGSGKTFISVLIIKHFGASLLKPYSEGGKITFFLVNSIPLITQQAKYIRNYTNFEVGCFSGELNLDGWLREEWEVQFNKYQVFVMTSQILLNIITANFIDISKINLIIFDECHKAVDDQPMRVIMRELMQTEHKPRILGLTATILNGNCKLTDVINEVRTLEVTFNSQVATVDGLEQVIGYSTNPIEQLTTCNVSAPNATQQYAVKILDDMIEKLKHIKIFNPVKMVNIADHLKPLDVKDVLRDLRNAIQVLIIHIEMLGSFGGQIACVSQLIKIERIKKHCQDINLVTILNATATVIGCAKEVLIKEMKGHQGMGKLYSFSTPKVLKLLELLQNFKSVSEQELCGLVFVKQRFTAKILYHIVKYVQQHQLDCYLKPNFVVGYNNNPYNDTRESMFISKKNREILEAFANHEYNLLIASNVLEEGVDIPKCTLVIRFDKPEDYRSYIQTKGRARHKLSMFYTIVDQAEYGKYASKYNEFQKIEQQLNDYLIGKNAERQLPSQDEIDAFSNEDVLPPYYVNGPNSAHVSMTSAVSLLTRYCASLPADMYTVYAPDWYTDNSLENYVKVVVYLPPICPITMLEGPPMSNVKDAKRAAALKACIALHKCGELDDNLLPLKETINEADISFLFTHWPEIKESEAGTKKNKRVYEKKIAKCVQGPIESGKPLYLHIITLSESSKYREDYNIEIIRSLYLAPQTFGIITANPLPKLCQFPIFTSYSQINVALDVNASTISLTAKELKAIRKFHHLVFDSVLDILNTKSFLIFDNAGVNSNSMLMVPVNRPAKTIDFHTIYADLRVKGEKDPTTDERLNVNVSDESYLYRIVVPWYRNNKQIYVVTKVLHDHTPLSPFPNTSFANYSAYYMEKYQINILKPHQPLLQVKGLSTSLNVYKPPGVGGKRSKDKRYDEMEEWLIPELINKEDFPSTLWVQAHYLPCILSRLVFLLNLHELQMIMANGMNANAKYLINCPALELDEHLLNYQSQMKPMKLNDSIFLTGQQDALAIKDVPKLTSRYNKDYATKMLEIEYPWKNIDEPKDLERELNVSILDIEIYENFICQKVSKVERMSKISSPQKTALAAITYPQEYREIELKLLHIKFDNQIPNLCEIYKAMTTAESNDIVNLERLEILGDSFLKIITSIYILFKFSKYNEGKSTTLKGRLVSNKNLYYLANRKNFANIMKNNGFEPKKDWVPPCYTVPPQLKSAIENGTNSIHLIFDANIPFEERLSGVLGSDTVAQLNLLQADERNAAREDDTSNATTWHFLNKQSVADKTVADATEAMLGAHLECGGFMGGIKFVEWLGLIPATENLVHLTKFGTTDPIVNPKCTLNVNYYLPTWRLVEEKIGYTFHNKNYLLQALTHSSYYFNHLTSSYERLEFIGDAILDFLITCYIYEHCGYLQPGKVTDLRSALVNNNTFASLAVRLGVHKDILILNNQLQMQIQKFVEYFTTKEFVIDDEVLILIEENDVNIAEYVDVPKVLGDVFEALAGAVFLDSGNDLNTVWKVFHKIMWKELDMFSKNVPINILRKLHECPTAFARFGETATLKEQTKTMIPLTFMCQGRFRTVHGFGSNKAMAKRAAAKIALRFLNL